MKLFFFIAALVSASVLAQDLTSLPACAQTCALGAISSTGCAVTDARCICKSTSFLSSVESCISTTCSASDQQATLTFAQQFCSSAGVTIVPHAATQATTQATTGSSPAPITTTLITTTDSSGNVFTVTGEVLVSGNSSTTVPCRTVITTNAAGVTVTTTETGSSVSYKDKSQAHRP
ncbi:hypothetical protein EDB80DRAFT_816625 [Ilyonectria destructans]|nr:hypothetical protein EDB80DRAFT_816625 [Ilyonectria destructans]